MSILARRVDGVIRARRFIGQRDHFYPRPPGGGRRCPVLPSTTSYPISIHALRVEGDRLWCSRCGALLFISIHALRVEGDRVVHSLDFAALIISIHALRVEGD